MKVIGIMGKAGSGKTTLASEITSKVMRIGCGYGASLRKKPVQIDSFAAPLKDFIKKLCDFTDDQLYGTEKDVVDPRYGVTPRYVMQQFGTDFVRKVLGEDFWIMKMQERMAVAKRRGVRLFIIDDVRLQNEAVFIKQEGTLIHVIRENSTVELGAIESKHESELPPDAPWAMVFNNEGPIEKLADKFFDQRMAIVKMRNGQ